jgi:hypothetical protein
MLTTEALTENSRQGINSKTPPCTGLEARLNRNPRWGCGHAYDETPADLVVYVRNDPVNYIDPDGRFAEPFTARITTYAPAPPPPIDPITEAFLQDLQDARPLIDMSPFIPEGDGAGGGPGGLGTVSS